MGPTLLVDPKLQHLDAHPACRLLGKGWDCRKSIYYYNYLQYHFLKGFRFGDVVTLNYAKVKIRCKRKKKNPFETITYSTGEI